MMWFTRIVTCQPSIQWTSILRTYNASHISSLRHISLSPGLKHIKTFTFSPPKWARQTFSDCKENNLLFNVSSSPLTRTHSILFRTLSQRSNNAAFLLQLRETPFKCTSHLFHTQRTCLARLGSGIQGSPDKNNSALVYIVAVFVLMLGGAYAGVPLYKVFCQASGLGGQAVSKDDTEKIENMQKVEDRHIRVRFNADVSSSMRWNFRPQQNEVTVLPGETALAFYTAKNPTDKPIIGISTYNVLPYDAGQYFNKIQCFCFEEQRLNPKEQVDMPVFFFIDPEFAEDPKLEHVDTITLSYTFFEAVDGLTLPLPGYPQPHDPVVPIPTPAPSPAS